MQYMSYMIQYFYTVLTNNRFDQPNFTDLFRIAESIMRKDIKEHEIQIKRIVKLNNSLDDIDISVAELELVFFKNAHKGINAKINIRGEDVSLGELFYKINEVIRELTLMVSDVAYQYDVDMPFNNSNGGKLSW